MDDFDRGNNIRAGEAAELTRRPLGLVKNWNELIRFIIEAYEDSCKVSR